MSLASFQAVNTIEITRKGKAESTPSLILRKSIELINNNKIPDEILNLAMVQCINQLFNSQPNLHR